MHKLVAVALLFSLALGTGCGFQFHNPVEQCPEGGCLDGGLLATDAALPDASPWQSEVIAPTDPLLHDVSFVWNAPTPMVTCSTGDTTMLGLRTEKGWATDALSSGATGSFLRALPSTSVPRNAAFDGLGLRYGEWTGLEWDRYPIDFPSRADAIPGVASDAKRAGLHMAACVEGRLLYARWDGNKTKVELHQEDLGPCDPGAPTVLVDDHDNAHVFYGSNGGARHSAGTLGRWSSEQAPQSANASRLHAAVLKNGVPIYCADEPGALEGSTSIVCHSLSHGAWTSRLAVPNQKGLRFMDFALADDESPRFLYSRTTKVADGKWTRTLLYAAETPLGLTETAVFEDSLTEPDPGSGALALDSSGLPHVVVRRGGNLVHVYLTQAQVPSTPWFAPFSKVQVVRGIPSGTQSVSVSVALAGDEPFLAIADDSGDHFATRSNGSWTTASHTRSSLPGTIAAVDGTVPAALSYSPADLFFIERTATAWNTFSLLPNSAEWGHFAASPSAAGVHVSTVRADGILRYGQWGGDRNSMVELTWEDLEAVGEATWPLAPLTGPRGDLHLLAFNQSTKRLLAFHRTRGGWSKEVLRENYDGWQGGAVATFDPQGELMYCWADPGATVHSLSASCARKVAGQWSVQPVYANRLLSLKGIHFNSAQRLELLVGPVSQSPFDRLERWVEDGSGWQPSDLVRAPPNSELRSSNWTFDSKGVGHLGIANDDRIYHMEWGP